ncbi:MAG: hypothetical protein ACR5LH_15020 [Sodalis sp. (in: enterobacteria)]
MNSISGLTLFIPFDPVNILSNTVAVLRQPAQGYSIASHRSFAMSRPIALITGASRGLNSCAE